METHRFSVVIEQADGCFFARCEEIDEIFIESDTYEEALERVKEAILDYLDERFARGDEVEQCGTASSMPFTVQYSLN